MTKRNPTEAKSLETVPLLEEILHVDVKEVVTGKVKIATHVETFEETARAELSADHIEISRKPIGRTIEGPLPQIRSEGDTTIIPVFEEVLVVEKRLVLKEEIHLTKTQTTEAVEQSIPLRKQKAEIIRTLSDREKSELQ